MPIARRSALALLALPALRPAAAEGAAARVALLHLNDVHSRHEAITASTAACRAGDACFGGSARIMTALGEARAAAAREGRAAFLLEAGDAFLGSLFFTHHQGMAEAAVQREWALDGFALGNHEFDLGPAVLTRYAAAVPFPVLCANLDATREANLAARVRPWVMLPGTRIAVLGLCTPDTPQISSPGPTLRFLDPAEAALRAAAQARAGGARTVVALTHLGVGADRRLAAAVPGLDVIVGGHSHTLLSGPAHPTLLDGPDRRVLMVQAGAHGRWLGRLDLDLSEAGRVVAHGGAVRELSADIAEEAGVRALVARLAEPLQALRRQLVGRLPEGLPNLSCATAPCALGELVAEAMRVAVAAEIGWQNGGGLRAGLPGGAVSVEDVLGVLPFGNTLARVTLRGADILAALENGASRLPGASGRFPQLAGLRAAFDASRPAGARVLGAEVRGADGGWAALEPGRAYTVATNSFLRRGGDGYAMFADAALEARDDGPLLEDALIRRLSR